MTEQLRQHKQKSEHSTADTFITESAIIDVLHEFQIELIGTLPCIKIQNLLVQASKEFTEIPLTREEEGIGIAGGAHLGGKRMALLIQSGGIGNSLNALLSFARFYEIPLPMIISWRGGPDECIEAQCVMGEALPKLLDGARIPYTVIGGDDSCGSGAEKTRKMLKRIYEENTPGAVLFMPTFWENNRMNVSNFQEITVSDPEPFRSNNSHGKSIPSPLPDPTYPNRHAAISALVSEINSSEFAEKTLIISNIGIPSRELYSISDHPRNFYMLGSLGLASSIGLGVALATDHHVVVIDGDGSLLMNPNALVTAAASAQNEVLKGDLTIVCIDNGVHGSTGDQETYAGKSIDLSELARAAGIELTSSSLSDVVSQSKNVPSVRFIHIRTGAGNEDVGVIPLRGVAIKERFMDFIRRAAP